MKDEVHAVTVSFGGNDAAFVENWRGESVRILRAVADLIEQEMVGPGDQGQVRDTNGNAIGFYGIRK
jgi:hypothetical protein